MKPRHSLFLWSLCHSVTKSSLLRGPTYTLKLCHICYTSDGFRQSKPRVVVKDLMICLLVRHHVLQFVWHHVSLFVFHFVWRHVSLFVCRHVSLLVWLLVSLFAITFLCLFGITFLCLFGIMPSRFSDCSVSLSVVTPFPRALSECKGAVMLGLVERV